MIRINLLPVKAEAKRELGQRQLILFVLVIVVALVGLYFFNGTVSAELDAANAEADVLKKKITELEGSVKDREAFVARRRDLLAQKAIFIDLHGRRSGPSKMLHELAMLLSPGRGPGAGWSITKDEYEDLLKESPGAEVHLSWDPTRVWIERIHEDTRIITIEGFAKSNDDAAEIQKRLALSKYFDAVELGALNAVDDAKTKERTVSFTITAVVNYSPFATVAGTGKAGKDAGKGAGDAGDKGAKGDPGAKPAAPPAAAGKGGG